MVTLTSAGLFFYQGQVVCSGLFNILSLPNEMIENASGSLSPGITDHLGFTIFISCINCHLPMGRRERVMRKRANPLAHVCCIPCWRIEKQMLVLRFRKRHWFLLWYRDLFKKKNQPSGPWLYAGLQNHPPANRKSVWQWIKCPVNGDRWRQLER